MTKTDSLLQEVEPVSTATPRCRGNHFHNDTGFFLCLVLQVADIQGDMYHLKQSLYAELRVSCVIHTS